MADTPFSVIVQEYGSGKFVLSGDINAVAALHSAGYYNLTGDIVGTLTLSGTGQATLAGTISGLFSGVVSAVITFFGVGKATIAGTVGNNTLGGALSIFGTGRASLVGSVVSSGPPPFDPRYDVPLLGLWDASDIVGLNDGDPCLLWPDGSSNGHDASFISVPGFENNKPVYKTNQQNGKPAVFFADQVYNALTTNLNFTEPFTIFAVYSYDGAAPGTHRAAHGQTNNWLIGPYNGNYQAFGGGGFASNPPAVVQNQFVYQTVTQAVDHTLTSYVNGVLRGTIAANTTPDAFQLGAYGGETQGGRTLWVAACNWVDSVKQGLVEGWIATRFGL